MSLKGWGIAIILSPFTLGLSIPLYFWYWFLKKIGKWYIRGLKIFFLMPAAIVVYIIARAFEIVVGDVKWITSIFTGGLENMQASGDSVISIPGLSQFKLRYIAAFGLALYVDFVLFIQPLLSGGIPEFSFTTLTSFFAVGLPFFVLVVFSGIVNKFSGADISGSTKELAGAGVAAGTGAAGASAAAPGKAASGAVGGAADAAGAAKGAADMYEDIEVAEAAETVGGGAEAAGAASGAEGILAGVAGSSIVTIGGPILFAAIAMWVMYSMIAIVISAVLLGMTWGYLSQVLPLIAGPIMGAIGLGGAYASWFGESTTNQFAPQLGAAFEDEIQAVEQLGAQAGCVLEGPQCLRQWQMNNTVRPGSEEVGETYELRINQFNLGVERIDTAYKEEKYVLPVNFLISNTRNGLKGVTARDVKYKILIKDAEETYCSTAGDEGNEWRSINSQGISGDQAVAESTNYILPGLGVSPTQSLEELNLADCELIQPSMGVNRVMELQLKYDYSSQATLYFDAMSREHRREQGIEPGFKQSETAKTPVQSYINVRSPATYYETQSGQRRAVPFSARFGFETPGSSAEYKIDPESIEIVDSSMTTETSECSGLNSDPEGENTYDISDRAKQRVELRQQEGWFGNNVAPAPLRCTMELSNPSQISPTGEELIMRIDANYTIKKTTQMESFSVWNTACNRVTCPMIVTEEYSEQSENDLFYECTRGSSIDSRDGCSVRVPREGRDKIQWQYVNLAERGDSDIVIDQGKKAAGASAFTATLSEKSGLSTYTTSLVKDNPNMPVGIEQGRAEETLLRNEGIVAYEINSDRNNLIFAGLGGALCEQNRQSSSSISSTQEALQAYLGEWEDKYGDTNSVYMIGANVVDCQRSIGKWILDAGGCKVENTADVIGALGQVFDPTQSLDSDKLEKNEACMDNAERLRACTGGEDSGVLVRYPEEDLRCYGGSF